MKKNLHPIFTDQMVLPTNELQKLTNEIDCWLNELNTGGCIYGNQRTGKTMAIRFLTLHLASLIKADIPTAMISMWETTKGAATENRFFMELLRVLGHEYPKTGTAADKRIRLINFIEDCVNRNEEHRFLLFVDEAQFLTDSQLKYLMDLHNQLKLIDIRLVTILVGQPELRHKRTHLLKSGKNHIVSRFYCNEFHFNGPSCEQDLKIILKYIDNNTEWPKLSGITYTQHFAPKAFENSWRLEHQSKSIWSQIESVIQERELKHAGELPMQAVVALIRNLLRYAQEKDAKDFCLTDKLIRQRIKKVAISNIENHLLQLKFEQKATSRSRNKAA